MEKLVILLMGFFFLSGCKTSRVTERSFLEEQRDVKKDITLIDDSRLNEAISRIRQATKRELLQISFTRNVYDTEKPVDSISGKHPLLSEDFIFLTLNTNTEEVDSTETKRESGEVLTLTGTVKDNTNTTIKEEVITKPQVTGFRIGVGIALVVVIVCVILYLKMKR